MTNRHLIIYCDESTDKGRYFSHFYGGALVEARKRQMIEERLQNVKLENNLGAELKWTKITESYKDKYITFADAFFDFIDTGDVKLRIMFTQNTNRAIGLDEQQVGNEYWLLYYQLIKHAFGLSYCGEAEVDTKITLYLDDVPDKVERFDVFRGYVASLSASPRFIDQRVSIKKEDITDVNSKAHTIMQGLDIILGAMQFRLNDKHLDKQPGQRLRSKRTRAKEDVYKHINRRIRALYPNFNIGVSTAISGDYRNRWLHPYRHWLFVPAEAEVLIGQGKPRNRRAP